MTGSTATRVATLNLLATTKITTTDRSHHAIVIYHATRMIVGNTLTRGIIWRTTIVARTKNAKTMMHHGIHGTIDDIIMVSGLPGITNDPSTTVVATIRTLIIGDPHKSSLLETLHSTIPRRLEKINHATHNLNLSMKSPTNPPL